MQEDLKQIIFLQTHLKNEEDNQQYLNIIEKLFGDKVNLYNMINVNEETDLYNINCMAKFFNEFCVFYYVYKNGLYKDYDIISLGHYRRFPNPNLIRTDKIMENIIQTYDVYLYLPNLFEGMINLDELKENYGDSYYYLYLYFYSLNYQKWIIDDMVEYFESQNIIPIDSIKKVLSLTSNPKWYRFIARSMVSINQNNFIKLMEFVMGYFNYLSNKYNFNIFNFDELKKWYFHNIILDLRKQNIPERIKKENITDIKIKNKLLLFQPIETYRKIYIDLDESGNGVDSYCNCYRYFGYIFETLVGVFTQSINDNRPLMNGLCYKFEFPYKGSLWKYQYNKN